MTKFGIGQDLTEQIDGVAVRYHLQPGRGIGIRAWIRQDMPHYVRVPSEDLEVARRRARALVKGEPWPE